MPVTTTPQQIMTAAYGRSKRNQPGITIAETVEGFQLVLRSLRALYQVAARVNPAFFGDDDDVPPAAGGWARPATAELVRRIEFALDGRRVRIVPLEERTAALGSPAVYRHGQIYMPAGNAGDPDPGADTLRIYFSKLPTDPANKDAALDPMWVESFNELLILEVAVYMEIKEGRDTIAVLKEERDRWARQYIAFLEHETVGEIRTHAEMFTTPSLVSLGSLFAGGANLAG